LANGKELNVSQDNLCRLTVCEKRYLQLCAGEKIKLKASCKLAHRKLSNGQILEIVGEDKKGRLLVKNIYGSQHALAKDFSQFQYGYASTSYSSQGQTVDHVLISDSQCKAASSQKEFYVSISRGRMSCTILTADKDSLQEHIQKLGSRDMASDLVLAPKNAQTDSQRPIVSPMRLQALLDPANDKDQAQGIDSRNGKRVEVYGNWSGRLLVRGLVELRNVLLRCVAGMFRLRENEREAENCL